MLCGETGGFQLNGIKQHRWSSVALHCRTLKIPLVKGLTWTFILNLAFMLCILVISYMLVSVQQKLSIIYLRNVVCNKKCWFFIIEPCRGEVRKINYIMPSSPAPAKGRDLQNNSCSSGQVVEHEPAWRLVKTTEQPARLTMVTKYFANERSRYQLEIDKWWVYTLPT